MECFQFLSNANLVIDVPGLHVVKSTLCMLREAVSSLNKFKKRLIFFLCFCVSFFLPCSSVSFHLYNKRRRKEDTIASAYCLIFFILIQIERNVWQKYVDLISNIKIK